MPRLIAPTAYRRKLSRHDVRTGSMLIDKRAWRLFLPPGEEFTVVVGRQEFRTCIVAEDCAPAGARLGVPPPHKHYHLEAGHFRHLLGLRSWACRNTLVPGSWFDRLTTSGTAHPFARAHPEPVEGRGRTSFNRPSRPHRACAARPGGLLPAGDGR